MKTIVELLEKCTKVWEQFLSPEEEKDHCEAITY